MNRPRRPNRAWIEAVRERNRAALGLSGLGQGTKSPGWGTLLILGLAGYLVWKWVG